MHSILRPIRDLASCEQAADASDASSTLIVEYLKECTRRRDVSKGIKLHADALRRGIFSQNVFVSSAVLNMYAKCGEIARAQQVFDAIPNPDLVTWNALIAGYVQHQYSSAALHCFQQMKDEGVAPSSVTFSCILKACSNLGAIQKGKEIHAELSRTTLLENERVVGTALVDMYAMCGALARAQHVFEDLSARDVVSWNALIKGYIQHGFGDEALKCFSQIKGEGISPNSATFICALHACGIVKADGKGKEIHCEIARGDLFGKNIMLGTALLDMYAKCGALSLAKEVFDKLPVQDTVSWNALLSGYCQHGYYNEVFLCLEKMEEEGLSLNSVSLLCALQACSNLECGTKIHAEIVRKGLLKRANVLGNALVHMYAAFGELSKAQELLDELPNIDQAAFTSLIQGYCQYGHEQEALNCYEQMQKKRLCPDAVTYACILNACGSIGAVELGKEVHAEIIEQGLLAKDCALGSALVDMYAKCGAVSKAQEVFDKLPSKNVDCWTALITAFAQIGNYHFAFELFNRMVGRGIKPNVVTFIVLLYACSALGLVNKGQLYFETMHTTYGMNPTLDHCTCMVDLFGRLGLYDRAIAVINKAPSNCLPGWFALLEASKKCTNIKLGTYAFEHAVQWHKTSVL